MPKQLTKPQTATHVNPMFASRAIAATSPSKIYGPTTTENPQPKAHQERDFINELARLIRLKDDGKLSPAEFAQEKLKVLGTVSQPVISQNDNLQQEQRQAGLKAAQQANPLRDETKSEQPATELETETLETSEVNKTKQAELPNRKGPLHGAFGEVNFRSGKRVEYKNEEGTWLPAAYRFQPLRLSCDDRHVVTCDHKGWTEVSAENIRAIPKSDGPGSAQDAPRTADAASTCNRSVAGGNVKEPLNGAAAEVHGPPSLSLRYVSGKSILSRDDHHAAAGAQNNAAAERRTGESSGVAIDGSELIPANHNKIAAATMPEPGTKQVPALTFKLGDKVEGKHKGKWYGATVADPRLHGECKPRTAGYCKHIGLTREYATKDEKHCDTCGAVWEVFDVRSNRVFVDWDDTSLGYLKLNAEKVRPVSPAAYEPLSGTAQPAASAAGHIAEGPCESHIPKEVAEEPSSQNIPFKAGDEVEATFRRVGREKWYPAKIYTSYVNDDGTRSYDIEWTGGINNIGSISFGYPAERIRRKRGTETYHGNATVTPDVSNAPLVEESRVVNLVADMGSEAEKRPEANPAEKKLEPASKAGNASISAEERLKRRRAALRPLDSSKNVFDRGYGMYEGGAIPTRRTPTRSVCTILRDCLRFDKKPLQRRRLKTHTRVLERLSERIE